MAVFICAIVLAAAVTSYFAHLILKRLGINKKFLVMVIAALNVLFCAAFPFLFALLSGRPDAVNRAPARGAPAVLTILILFMLLYVIFIVWRIVLRSPALSLNTPIPEPESADANAGFAKTTENDGLISDRLDIDLDFDPKVVEITQKYSDNANIIDGYEKDTVDTATNIDKMGIITELHHTSDENDVNSLVNRAFDSLGGGKLDEAAEYFYSAIENHPPLNLEIQIAIQLCMVYLDLGQADLAFDILVGYNDQYRNRLSDEDKSILETGISMIESVVTDIGGNGYEKN